MGQNLTYGIVTLAEKKIAGLAARANNSAPRHGVMIGRFWKTFYEEGVCAAMSGKGNGKALGVYTDYASEGQSMLISV